MTETTLAKPQFSLAKPESSLVKIESSLASGGVDRISSDPIRTKIWYFQIGIWSRSNEGPAKSILSTNFQGIWSATLEIAFCDLETSHKTCASYTLKVCPKCRFCRPLIQGKTFFTTVFIILPPLVFSSSLIFWKLIFWNFKNQSTRKPFFLKIWALYYPFILQTRGTLDPI